MCYNINKYIWYHVLRTYKRIVDKLSCMKVKIDTKERFHAITLPGDSLSATMTEELAACLLPYLQNDVKNVVLILKDIQNIDIAAAEKLVSIQQSFYESNASFVICELQKPIEEFLDKNELLEVTLLISKYSVNVLILESNYLTKLIKSLSG